MISHTVYKGDMSIFVSYMNIYLYHIRMKPILFALLMSFYHHVHYSTHYTDSKMSLPLAISSISGKFGVDTVVYFAMGVAESEVEAVQEVAPVYRRHLDPPLKASTNVGQVDLAWGIHNVMNILPRL